MTIHRLSNAPEIFHAGQSTGHLVAETNGADIVLLNLAPGAHIPPHALDLPALFAVSEGSAMLTAGDETTRLSAGDVAKVDPGVLREWKNPNEQPCSIFVLKRKGTAECTA
jgi:quercetin dioxygenase-like cupin family protein